MDDFTDVVSYCCVTKLIFMSQLGISSSQNAKKKLTSDTSSDVVSIYPSRALWSLPCWSRQGHGPGLALGHVPVVGWA